MSTEVQSPTAESIRQRLASLKRRYRPLQLFDGDILWIRSLTTGENGDASTAAHDKREGFSQARYHRELIVRSLVTGPDTVDPKVIQDWEAAGNKHERVFKDSEQAQVVDWQHYVVQPLISRIDQLNSFGEIIGYPPEDEETDDTVGTANMLQTVTNAARTKAQKAIASIEVVGG